MMYRSALLLFIPCLILRGVAEPSKRTVLSGECAEGGCGTSLLMRGTNSFPQPVALVEDSLQTEQMRNQKRLQTEAFLVEVQALAEKVMHGEQKVDNVTMASLNMIRELMKSIVNDTALEHAEDQAEVDQAHASIGVCTTKAQTDLTTVGNTNSVVGQDRTAHNECRDDEVVHLMDKTTKCNDFQDYASGLEPPACSAAFPPGPSDGTWECIMEMALWSTTANVTYPTKLSSCSTATTVHSTTKLACDNKQGTFESAFCSYAELLNKACADQTWCRNTTINARDTTHSRVRISEAARAAEYKSAKHVMCYLNVFNATQEQMPSVFAACHNSTYSTSHLVINYPSTPDEHPCDASPVTHVPCDADWLEDEYEANNAWYNVAKENRYTSTTEYVLPADCAMCAWTVLAAAYVGSRGVDGFPTGVFTGNPRFPTVWQWDPSIMQPGTTTGNVANFNSASFADGFCGVQWNGEISQVTVTLLTDAWVAFAWSDDGSDWYESPSGSMSTPHSGFTGSGKVLTPPSQARYFGVTSGDGNNRCASIAIEATATTTQSPATTGQTFVKCVDTHGRSGFGVTGSGQQYDRSNVEDWWAFVATLCPGSAYVGVECPIDHGGTHADEADFNHFNCIPDEEALNQMRELPESECSGDMQDSSAGPVNMCVGPTYTLPDGSPIGGCWRSAVYKLA